VRKLKALRRCAVCAAQHRTRSSYGMVPVALHTTRHPKADIEVDANAASELEDAKVNAE
jgi:hypothetical protein